MNSSDIALAQNLIEQFTGSRGRAYSNLDRGPRRTASIADCTQVEPQWPYRVERVIWRATPNACNIGEFVWRIHGSSGLTGPVRIWRDFNPKQYGLRDLLRDDASNAWCFVPVPVLVYPGERPKMAWKRIS